MTHPTKLHIEMFPCAGGMAEGFRRAGIHFDIAIEFMPDHCASYEQNLGHRPLCMDVRDFLRMLRSGFRFPGGVELLVADPPCTPWSHAGKRKGTKDERDMLVDTCEIISILQPDAYLIGNVPGLDDSKNLAVVQEHIGGLARYGYCTADFIKLDAADYGVPQRRVRPFWFGHKQGSCIQWPAPTHGGTDAVADDQPTLPGITPLQKWVTCWEALKHLPAEEIGRPVRVKRIPRGDAKEMFAPSNADDPAKTVTAQEGSRYITGGDEMFAPSSPDQPAKTLRAAGRTAYITVNDENHVMSEPAKAVLAGDGGGSRRLLEVPQGLRVGDPEKPSKAVTAKAPRKGTGESHVMEWPWKDRPATVVQADERLAPPGHHDENFATRSLPNAVVISEKAGAILQGFPEDWVFVGKTKKARWSQIGQAMPPGLAHPVASSVARQMGIGEAHPTTVMLNKGADIVPIEKAKRSRKAKGGA